jgi:serine/threonine-protein kinase
MLGKYERLDVLGHGVSGIVYLARDTMLNKQVAVKEIDVQAGDVHRFLEEARVMDRLRHPNIVRVENVDRIDDKVILVMEYVRGRNLQETLRGEGALSRERALDYAAQILDALDYAHRMQTVHRDIKPANILVGRDGIAKLADFGLAEILATNAYAGGAGTYAYMAPEDFAEEDRSDHQSDLWAIGVTLFEMLTAHRPFQVARVKDPFAWKRALENEPPARLSDYLSDAPADLQAILDRALAKDKRQRYQSAKEFRDDILRAQQGQSLSLCTQELAQKAEQTAKAAQEAMPEISPKSRAAVKTHAFKPEFDIPRQPVADPIGPGRVVADVRAEAERSPKTPPKPGKEVKLSVEPRLVDFGIVRKGDLRTAKMKVRVDGIRGAIAGSIGKKPDWLTVHPQTFTRTRQAITLTAHSGRVWETGEFQDTLTVLTEHGTCEVPVQLTVLKPRPTFGQIALWYVPLFVSTLLPALAVAFLSSVPRFHAAGLVPVAALASALLALMLLLICVAADLGIGERIACGVVMATMCFVLGVVMARPQFTSTGSDLTATGVIGGLVVLLQLIHLSRWKLWAVTLLGLSLLLGGTFLRLMN